MEPMLEFGSGFGWLGVTGQELLLRLEEGQLLGCQFALPFVEPGLATFELSLSFEGGLLHGTLAVGELLLPGRVFQAQVHDLLPQPQGDPQAGPSGDGPGADQGEQPAAFAVERAPFAEQPGFARPQLMGSLLILFVLALQLGHPISERLLSLPEFLVPQFELAFALDQDDVGAIPLLLPGFAESEHGLMEAGQPDLFVAQVGEEIEQPARMDVVGGRRARQRDERAVIQFAIQPATLRLQPRQHGPQVDNALLDADQLDLALPTNRFLSLERSLPAGLGGNKLGLLLPERRFTARQFMLASGRLFAPCSLAGAQGLPTGFDLPALHLQVAGRLGLLASKLLAFGGESGRFRFQPVPFALEPSPPVLPHVRLFALEAAAFIGQSLAFAPDRLQQAAEFRRRRGGEGRFGHGGLGTMQRRGGGTARDSPCREDRPGSR